MPNKKVKRIRDKAGMAVFIAFNRLYEEGVTSPKDETVEARAKMLMKRSSEDLRRLMYEYCRKCIENPLRATFYCDFRGKAKCPYCLEHLMQNQ